MLLVPMFGLAQPRIFYTDLDSGPNAGGESGAGAFITLYGRGFGSTQGASYVTVGGGRASFYPVWNDSKISFQLNAASVTGGIVVSTGAGSSNSVPFTVRAGAIYFVAPNGSDSNNGSVSAPWKTIIKARNTIGAGDIAYLRNGITQSTDDGQGWNACFTIGGTSGLPGKPKALAGYPGETASIGNTDSSCGYGIRGKGQGENYWTIANLTLRGQNLAIGTYASTGWRIVGNDISCPNGNGQAGCLDVAISTDFSIYGNNIHHVATNLSPSSVTALYHGVYISEQAANVDFGWNTVAYVQGCRGIQQNVNQGAEAYGVLIHDNLIHDTQCDGIVMTTVDPSKGAVSIYNNVIYNAGTGPNNAEGSGAWNCINVQGWDPSGSTAGSGTIRIYGNTLHNCGTFANPPYKGSSGGILWSAGNNPVKNVLIQNNIIYTPAGIPYVTAYAAGGSLCMTCSAVSGSNNLFYGNGVPPIIGSLSNTLNSDPLFVSANGRDYHLQGGSPAAMGGIATGQATDFDGVPLPNVGAYPIGAFASNSGGNTSAVSVTLSPGLATLFGGQQLGFTSSVTGTTNTSITFSLVPPVGSISSSGVYTSPAVVPLLQTVVVTATSAADPTKSAIATLTLLPIGVSVNPALSTLAPGQQLQLSGVVTSATNTAVTWKMSPSVGTLSATGLYAAPSSVAGTQVVTITATSVADPTKFANSVLTILPAAGVVSISVSPTSATLSPGQSIQLAASVAGTVNTGVAWKMSPALGTLSAAGVYTAPATTTSTQTVTITATPLADSTKAASAVLSIRPTVSVSVSPGSVALSPGQKSQFAATVTGSATTSVTWSISPAVGSISAAGLYTAPSSVTSQRTVTVKATSTVDTTKSGTATVTVSPSSTPGPVSSPSSSTFAIQFAVAGSSVSVTWSAPANRPKGDSIVLASPSAPDWWYSGNNKVLGGDTSGAFTIPLPSTPGLYEFRYWDGATQYKVLARSAVLPVSVAGFAVTTPASTVTKYAALPVTWTAPLPRAGDYIGLFSQGAPNDQPIWWVPAGKANGTAAGWGAPGTAGTYELRYISAGGYTMVVKSGAITVQ